MPKLETRPLAWFIPDPKQPRKLFDELELRRLGESLKDRQNEPVQAKPDGTIIDGERRWRAAKLVGLDRLDVVVTEHALTDTQVSVVRLTSFFHKADLTAYEKWLACTELLCGNPSWQLKDLAAALKIDPSSVSRFVSPSKTTPAWQQALRDGKVGISDCYQASQLSDSEQEELLRLRLHGATRDEIARIGRKKRTSGQPAVKVSRVSLALPTGVQVVVSGRNALSIDDLIDGLAEAQSEAKRARQQGMDAKTFAAAMKCKCKAMSEGSIASGDS